jgi:hypothetical protein
LKRKDYKRSEGFDDAKEVFGEEFGENAWDDDEDDDEGSDEEDQDDDAETITKPDQFRLALYKQATAFVNGFLKGDKADRGKIDELNQKIDEQNKKENITGRNKFFIQTQVLEALSNDLQVALDHYHTDPNDERPVRSIVGLDEQLEKLKRINSYPADWILPIPKKLRPQIKLVKEKLEKERVEMQRKFGGASGEKGKERERRPSAERTRHLPNPSPNKANEKQRPSGGSGEPPGSSRDKSKKARSQGSRSEPSSGLVGEPSGSSRDKGKGAGSQEPRTEQSSGRFEEPSGSSRDESKGAGPQEPRTEQSSTVLDQWRPGLTEKCEKIFAMAPHTTHDAFGNETVLRCKYVVEKPGQRNPIVFEDIYEVGLEAANAYWDLPEDKRVDIRTKNNSYSPNDRKGYIGIYGVTPEPSNSNVRFSNIAIVAEWNDGFRSMNRTGWRAIWKSKADLMIEDFFSEQRLEIPWAKPAKRPGQARLTGHRETRLLLESDSRTERSSHRDRPRSISRHDRRRSLSRNSIKSLSDGGAERLEAMKTQMKAIDKRSLETKLDIESKLANFGAQMRSIEGMLSTMMATMRVVT